MAVPKRRTSSAKTKSRKAANMVKAAPALFTPNIQLKKLLSLGRSRTTQSPLPTPLAISSLAAIFALSLSSR